MGHGRATARRSHGPEPEHGGFGEIGRSLDQPPGRSMAYGPRGFFGPTSKGDGPEREFEEPAGGSPPSEIAPDREGPVLSRPRGTRW